MNKSNYPFVVGCVEVHQSSVGKRTFNGGCITHWRHAFLQPSSNIRLQVV